MMTPHEFQITQNFKIVDDQVRFLLRNSFVPQMIVIAANSGAKRTWHFWKAENVRIPHGPTWALIDHPALTLVEDKSYRIYKVLWSSPPPDVKEVMIYAFGCNEVAVLDMLIRRSKDALLIPDAPVDAFESHFPMMGKGEPDDQTV